MKNEDLWKVMKWVGYVYIPVVIVFILVYLFVQYRDRTLYESHSPPVATGTSP